MSAYRSASSSSIEDLFIELFADTFDAEKAGYLYSQYPFSNGFLLPSRFICAPPEDFGIIFREEYGVGLHRPSSQPPITDVQYVVDTNRIPFL